MSRTGAVSEQEAWELEKKRKDAIVARVEMNHVKSPVLPLTRKDACASTHTKDFVQVLRLSGVTPRTELTVRPIADNQVSLHRQRKGQVRVKRRSSILPCGFPSVLTAVNTHYIQVTRVS